MKTLRELLSGIPCSWNGKGELATAISHVQSDSRKIQPGDLFVAISGFHDDGYQFIKDAIRKGAKAVVAERFDSLASDLGIPQFSVPNARAVLSHLVACSYDFPAQKLTCIGVTGTNGKTTTTFLIQYLLNAVSRSGLIGSIYYDDGKDKQAAESTTPVPEVLNETLARMVQNGLSYCVMEISSHALDQNRTRDIAFSSAVFTNLTQDHLDYHHDYEAYYQAKRKLFFGNFIPKHSIVNADDSFGTRLLKELSKRDGIVSYGEKGSRDYLAQQIQIGLNGIAFDLIHSRRNFSVAVPLILQHNVYNTLAALSTVSEEGFSLNDLIPELSSFSGVPGRLERIDEGQDFQVFVDYAHTPDGLHNVLSSLGGLSKNRVISVFGCGGDRDRGKRPMMGKIVSRFSDVVILTSDNPRSEKPEDILEEIKRGIDGNLKKTKLIVNPDRKEAIRQAIGLAESGDLIFVFGKGHEDYQIIGKEKKPFSDQAVVRQWLREHVHAS